MLIVGVYHDDKYLDQIVAHMKLNYDRPKSMMIELSQHQFSEMVENSERNYVVDNFFMQFFAKFQLEVPPYGRYDKIKPIFGDVNFPPIHELQYWLDGIYTNKLSKQDTYSLLDCMNTSQKPVVHNNSDTRVTTLLKEYNINKARFTRYFANKTRLNRNQGMFDVICMRKPDWVVVGDMHAAYLKQQFPNAYYIRFTVIEPHIPPKISEQKKYRASHLEFRKRMKTTPDELILLPY